LLSADERQWLAPVIIGICALLTPVWGWIAAKNKYTKEVLDTGWTPVISAMLISRLVEAEAEVEFVTNGQSASLS
jgi:solute carrier family 41